MILKDFIAQSLRKDGYDGLYNAGIECACLLDDLMPCGEPGIDECCAGYRCECTDESCAGYGRKGHFHVCARKPHSHPTCSS